MSQENQDSVYKWIKDTFPGGDPNTPRKAIRALEEMIELCWACGAPISSILEAVERGMRGCGVDKFGDWNAVPKEAADVLIVLYGLAGLRGFDLGEAVDAKMAINRARKWKALGDGTGYHVKDEGG